MLGGNVLCKHKPLVTTRLKFKQPSQLASWHTACSPLYCVLSLALLSLAVVLLFLCTPSPTASYLLTYFHIKLHPSCNSYHLLLTYAHQCNTLALTRARTRSHRKTRSHPYCSHPYCTVRHTGNLKRIHAYKEKELHSLKT